jgi:hypothetical protein
MVDELSDEQIIEADQVPVVEEQNDGPKKNFY